MSSPGYLRPLSFLRKDGRLLCLRLLFKVRCHPACHCNIPCVDLFKFLCLSVSGMYFCQLERYHQNHTRAALKETETMSRIEVPLGGCLHDDRTPSRPLIPARSQEDFMVVWQGENVPSGLASAHTACTTRALFHLVWPPCPGGVIQARPPVCQASHLTLGRLWTQPHPSGGGGQCRPRGPPGNRVSPGCRPSASVGFTCKRSVMFQRQAEPFSLS